MHRMQEKTAERAGAEDRDFPGVSVWAYSEELYDCHPGRMESYLKQKTCMRFPDFKGLTKMSAFLYSYLQCLLISIEPKDERGGYYYGYF